MQQITSRRGKGAGRQKDMGLFTKMFGTRSEREVKKLSATVDKVKQDGYALIPISVYFKGSLVKVEIALAKGKKLYDKRDDAAKKDAKRQIDRAMKGR